MAGTDAGMEALKRERERLKNAVSEAKDGAERLEQAASEARGSVSEAEQELAQVEETIRKLIGAR